MAEQLRLQKLAVIDIRQRYVSRVHTEILTAVQVRCKPYRGFDPNHNTNPDPYFDPHLTFTLTQTLTYFGSSIPTAPGS